MRKNSVLLFQTMGRIRFDIRLFLWSICNSLRTHCFPCGISQILQIKDEKCFQEEKNNYKKKISCQGFVKLEIKWKGSLVFLKELWLLQEIDGVRKEKERLTIACFMSFSVIICIIIGSGEVVYLHFFFNIGLQVIYLSSLLQIIYF